MASAAITKPKSKKPMKASRIWWHVHQWVGFKLSLFMAFVCLTGSIAVLSHEIDWLLNPSLRVAPSTVSHSPDLRGEPDWNRVALAAANYPHVARIQYVSKPTAGAFAVRVMVAWDDGRLGYLHIHPTTGEVQGVGQWVDAARIFRNMHRHLNLPVKYGVPIVGSMGVLLLISLMTSFIVYKKWWRGFLRAPRGRDARTWWGDFHRLAGVWSLWFVALIAATGIWYLVEQLGARAPVPKPPEVAVLPGGLPAAGARFAASLASVRAAAPDLAIETISFPGEKSGAFVFGGQRSAWLVRPSANTVWAEADGGRAVASHDAVDLTVHQRISEMADPLHFGTFGGYWTKIPWFLFGLLLTALSVSGVAVYTLRIGRELKLPSLLRADAARAWRGMGKWRWLAAAGILTAFVMLPALFAQRA